LLTATKRPQSAELSESVQSLRSDADWLQWSIAELANVGAQDDGSVCRRGFTKADGEGRQLVAQWMEEAGLSIRIDPAGNLIGRWDGEEPGLPTLVTGSHIDTVPTGGHFDGALGVLAGLDVVRTLKATGRRLRHPLEVIAFADEESTMVGCKGMTGTASADPADYTTSNGDPIAVNLERIGGHWPSLASARRDDTAIAAFLELHVEQGSVLESRGDAIGVVDGVVGQRRFSIRITGQANHAGTTPMDLRQDALVTAADVVLAIEALAIRHPGDPVATVGRLQVWPNAANVVPGSVEMTVDLRDLSPQVLEELVDGLMQDLETIGERRQCSIAIEPQFEVAPTPADALVIEAIAASAADLGLSFSHLPSRASHDAQELGRRWPMGMIFVPSRGGFSHSAAEFTSAEQCRSGTAVLLEALRRLDQML
jgi:N-carbamoyl-L-amino-acid hydrolase